jgi:uncharacterized protein DUF1579
MHRTKVLIACFAMAAAGVAAADDKPAAPAPDHKAMMEAWTKFATPGPGHKALEPLVGTWNAKVTSWMAPGAAPIVSDGVSENSWILGGRYLQQKHEGSFMGQPFSGLGYTAYDNYKKQYLATWMDNMGTSILSMAGTADDSGKTLTMEGKMDDFLTGRELTVKSTLRILDGDHDVYEMWSPGPDGKMFKMMEIDYTRKK